MNRGRSQRMVMTVPVVLTIVVVVIAVQFSALTNDPTFQADLDVVKRTLNPQSDQVAGEIRSERSVAQTFTASLPMLSRVELRLATYARVDEVAITLELRSASSGEVVRVSQAPPGAVEDNAYHSFAFQPIPGSRGAEYVASLRSPGARPGNALTAWIGRCDCYPEGHAIVGGKERQGLDLTMRVGYSVAETTWYTELLNRLSQYKPGFFKGEVFWAFALLWIVVSMISLGLLIGSLTQGPAVRDNKQTDESTSDLD